MKLLNMIAEIVNTVGFVGAVINIVGAIITVCFCVRYVFPLMWRFGLGAWRRQISIISDDTALVESLRMDLVSTRTLRGKNIRQVPMANVKDLPKGSIVIIDCGYFDMEGALADVVKGMDANVGVVLYCRPECERLSEDLMKIINNSSRVVLTNFRGRLVNDVIASLVSTPYD